MATWKDGPRYAPRVRPYGFAAPGGVTDLGGPPLPAALTAEPVVPPADYRQDTPGVPLESIVPIPTDTRDPRQAFATVTAALTAEGTGGVRTSPTEPFRVASSTPVPTVATWAPPPENARPARIVRPTTIRDVFTAAYPPALITLAVTGLVAIDAAYLSVVVLAAAPFVFAPRLRFRGKVWRAAVFVVLGILAIGWLAAQVMNTTVYNSTLPLNLWTMYGCWALAIADLILQWWGLRSGDRPTNTA